MTKPQRIHFFAQLWPDACAAQGWPENNRDFRLDKLTEWLGRKIETIAQLNNTRDFDDLKAHAKAAARPADIEPQIKAINQPRRRKIWKIRHLVPKAYLDTLLARRFAGKQPEDMTDSELHQLLCTVDARANKLRRRARQPENEPF